MGTERLDVVAFLEALKPTVGGSEINFLYAGSVDTEGGCKFKGIRLKKCIGDHDVVGCNGARTTRT